MQQKNCVVCGNIFSKKQNHSKKYWEERKCCSKECAGKISCFKKGHTTWNKGLKGYRAGELNNRWKGGQINKKCIICDESFMVDPFRKNTSRFCSHKCQYIWMKGRRPSVDTEFKPIPDEIKSINLSVRSTSKYRQWRTAVFQRDNYTCQICRRKTKKGIRITLNAHHHKIYFADLLKENDITTTEQAIKCDKLWDLSLAITLCRDCHIEAHTNDVYDRLSAHKIQG